MKGQEFDGQVDEYTGQESSEPPEFLVGHPRCVTDDQPIGDDDQGHIEDMEGSVSVDVHS